MISKKKFPARYILVKSEPKIKRVSLEHPEREKEELDGIDRLLKKRMKIEG